MGIEHGGVGTYLPAADQVDEGGHGLALVDRIGDHALGARGEPHRVEGRAVGIDEAADRREQMQSALRRYTTAIARHHKQDGVLPAAEGDG